MSVPIKMKITKEKLQQIIKEEYQRALNEMDDPNSYEGYLTNEERSEFVEAYRAVEQLRRIKPTALPESVEDAIFDMLHKLGIYL